MLIILQRNRYHEERGGEKFGSGSVINIKRNRDTKTQENLHHDYTDMHSLTLSAGIAYYMDTSLNQTIIRDSAFTPANWLMYSMFIALPSVWAYIALYSRRVPILRGPSNSINTGLKVAIIGFEDYNICHPFE